MAPHEASGDRRVITRSSHAKRASTKTRVGSDVQPSPRSLDSELWSNVEGIRSSLRSGLNLPLSTPYCRVRILPPTPPGREARCSERRHRHASCPLAEACLVRASDIARLYARVQRGRRAASPGRQPPSRAVNKVGPRAGEIPTTSHSFEQSCK